MKKILISITLLLIAIPFIFLWSLGAPFDRESSEFYTMPPPENLNRTIYNTLAKHHTTFLRKSHETDGAYTLLEITLEPGGSNGPHFHQRFAEIFTGVEGQTGVHVNGTDYQIGPGETVRAEINDVHYFFNDSDETAVFQVRIEPGSQGFEKSLYILYGLVNAGMTDEDGLPLDIAHTAVFAAYSDTRAPGILRLINPVFDRLAGRAQRDGTERALIERFYLSEVSDDPDESEPDEDE
ncbi:Cupin domain-containing protein [Cyclonatronum proteinivorum]|uniref:Cupin domain-containing protein n=1 Tax=Cyclonatronum proteinivorum TaxID=1457365 RepID=A0A345UMS3_9BACT|nr:cupin domain-containing protein [Cyclonatronum proteinivorum]AXJ01775.1 Cupin domain-containing protein [Cyclonatronum proteinivorum]